MINILHRVARSPRILQLKVLVVVVCTLAVATTFASIWFLDGRHVVLYATLCLLLCANVVLSYFVIRVSLRASKRRKESAVRLNEIKSMLSLGLAEEAKIELLKSELSLLREDIHRTQERDEHLHGVTRKRIRSKFADTGAKFSQGSNNVVRETQSIRAELREMQHKQSEVIDTLRDVSLLLSNQRERGGIHSLEVQAAFLALLEELQPIGDSDQADMEGPSNV